MSDNDSTRKDIRVPNKLIAEVTEYQKRNDIRYWTSALLLLVRKGLDAEKKESDIHLLFCLLFNILFMKFISI